MKIAFMGQPRSGKTTIFCALSGMEFDRVAFSGNTRDPVRSLVSVGDLRLSDLSERYQPEKTTPATVEFADIPMPAGDESRGGNLPDPVVSALRSMDALALVLRNFDDPVEGTADPERDFHSLLEEFSLADLITAENRIERIAWSLKRGQKEMGLAVEQTLMIRLREHLEESHPLSELQLEPHELRMIRGYGFLTLKPLMIIVNSEEASFGNNETLVSRLSEKVPALECAGLFERELTGISSEEDRELFMEDIGVTESARDRITRLAYRTLGYISFFTVGSDEVRAWNLRRGRSAREAAGVIHSDLARGFIRAECFHYEDLAELGSEAAIKERGRLRLEGKDYIVKDGDILGIRSGV